MVSSHSAAVLAGAAAILFLKGLVLSYVQVAARYRARSFNRPEDARLLGLSPGQEPDVAARAAGALRNEAENAPFFLALAAAYVLIGGAPLPLIIVSSLYVVARLVQAYAQVQALQPQRMIAYIVSVAAILALALLTALQA